MLKIKLILRLVFSYIVGLVIGNIAAAPFSGALSVAFLVGGLVLALPILAFALAIALIFETNIQDHLGRWCLSAPLVISAAWLCSEYLLRYAERGHSFFEYLTLGAVWERAALALVCAVACSGIFYLLMRIESASEALQEK